MYFEIGVTCIWTYQDSSCYPLFFTRLFPATIRPISDLPKGPGSELSPDLGFLALLIIIALHLLIKYTIYRGFKFPLRVRKIYLMHLLLDEDFLCRRRPIRNPACSLQTGFDETYECSEFFGVPASPNVLDLPQSLCIPPESFFLRCNHLLSLKTTPVHNTAESALFYTITLNHMHVICTCLHRL